MSYMLLRGQFTIRYPDLPLRGPEPDGDTVKFKPDTPGLVETLPRRSGTPADINGRGISVRLEAIDALETHFAETHQELAGWNLVDARGHRLQLSGVMAGGAALQLTLDGSARLGNRGDTVVLVDPVGGTADQVTYKADQIHAGRTICFGR